MDKFKNKYRIQSARLNGWDYRNAGAYFITICTSNRLHYFGSISGDQMIFSNIGIIADILWYEIANHNKNVELGEFVVMPNHIHGILIINDDIDNNIDHTTHTRNPMSDISPKSGSISTIIRSYKSAVSKHAHRLGYEFQWQSRFYDHIIRNDADYKRIANYIINNPSKWESNKFYDHIKNH